MWRSIFSFDCFGDWRILKQNVAPLIATMILAGIVAGAFLAVLAMTTPPGH